MGNLRGDVEIPNKDTNHPNASKYTVSREIQPRPTRKGRRLFPWLRLFPEYLATIYASYLLGHRMAAEVYEVLVWLHPDVVEQYREITGCELTPSIVYQRIDKAHRQQEIKNYAHLIPLAMEEVRRYNALHK